MFFVLSVIRFLRTDVGSRSNRNRDFVSTSWSCDELLRLVFVLSSFFSAVLVISQLFNPAENTNSCLSFVQPLNASRTRLDRNQGVGELVFLSVREGITDNLMFHVRLPEKICF